MVSSRRRHRTDDSQFGPNSDLEVRDTREWGLDNTLAETFPCSDPLSSIPNPQPDRSLGSRQLGPRG